MSLLDRVRAVFRADAAAPEPTKQIRRDGWYNATTGLGSALRDKTVGTAYYANATLSDVELDALFNDNDLAETIVSAVVDDAFRQGFGVESDEDDDDEREKEIAKRCEELSATAKLAEAAVMGRLFGGAALYATLEDGQDPAEELDVDRVRKVYSLHVIDRRYLSPVAWYADARSGKIGDVETYRVSMSSGQFAASPIVHESRLIMFGGLRTTKTRRDRLAGWDRSALQPAYDVLRKVGGSFDGVMQLMADMSQAVWKIKGLVEMIAAGQEDTVRARMEIVELARSMFKAVMLDSEGEEFERKATPLGGIPETMTLGWQRLAAATTPRMPLTRLFGMSPAGMNATGESDTRNWYDAVKAYQTLELRPRVTRLVQLVARSLGEEDPSRFTVTFPSLWQMTAKEQAELEKLVADKDKAYIDAGVVLAEEIALSRWGSGSFATDTKIDVELRKALQDKEAESLLNPPPVAEPMPSQSGKDADAEEAEAQSPEPAKSEEKTDALERLKTAAAAAANLRLAGLKTKEIADAVRAAGVELPE